MDVRYGRYVVPSSGDLHIAGDHIAVGGGTSHVTVYTAKWIGLSGIRECSGANMNPRMGTPGQI